jgi:phosphoserine phosphatase RsbU/P
VEDYAFKCVLVVDDEEEFRRLVRIHFSRDPSYRILEAADGIAALEVYQGADSESPIDLVITDFRMPRMNGLELIKSLRLLHPYLPIIGVTAYQDLSEQLKVLEVGGFYFLERPLPAWPIVERIIDTAIRLFRTERHMRETRAKEIEIAGLLRSYIMQNRVEGAAGDLGVLGGIALDIAVLPAVLGRPGGDLVEWFRRTPSEVMFYLADAMGHDLVACFVACMNSMVTHRSHHGRRPSLEELVAGVDHAVSHLCAPHSDNARRHYLTLFLGCVNLEFRELRYVNAGHPPGLLIRPGTPTRRLGKTFRPIGLPLPGPVTTEMTYLQPGDLLFLYTDGVFDVLSAGEPTPGLESLENLLAPIAGQPAEAIVQAVEKAMRQRLEHDGITDFQDDTTFVAIKVRGDDGGGK